METLARFCVAVGLVLPLVTGPIAAAQSLPVRDSVWQWSILVRSNKYNPGLARAFLWIPPQSESVRAVVLAQHNMEEISILENRLFRQAMAELNFAEVWVAPSFDHLFRFNEGAGDVFQGIMDDLAIESGYDELITAPIAGLGHSAAASWPYYFAAWNPQRTLAAISVSGQWPYVRNQFAPDIWGERSVDYVPCLETMGEYEAADTWSGEGLKERQAHPLIPLSMLACPAEGHFASSDAKVEFLAFYLRKAAQYRLPPTLGTRHSALIPIDPTKIGWLADKWRLGQPPTAPPAPAAQYIGDPKEAFWYFDQETAKAIENYGARQRGPKSQLVGLLQHGQFVPQTDTHLQLTPKFEPQADGVTFKLLAAFYETVPAGSPRLPRWTGLPAGAPIGHAHGGGPISIDRICGPFEKVGPDTFALRLQKGITGREERYELVLAATHPGDKQYKPAVQQAHIFVPGRNKEGADQHIAFPAIPDQKAEAKSLKLTAISDSNMPVYYYVREGPAEVERDTLTFTPIPSHATQPVKVTVVAWQYGRSIEPKIKTAVPVERTFHITR
jgi:hypothetical protein